MMTHKLVDPVHFYTESGIPISAYEKLKVEHEALLKEHEKLKRVVTALAKQRAIAAAENLEKENPTIH